VLQAGSEPGAGARAWNTKQKIGSYLRKEIWQAEIQAGIPDRTSRRKYRQTSIGLSYSMIFQPRNIGKKL
jgi:hypothetical protein